MLKKITEFVNGSFEEVRLNVTWPTFKELQFNTATVLVAVLLLSLVIGGMDAILNFVFQVIHTL